MSIFIKKIEGYLYLQGLLVSMFEFIITGFVLNSFLLHIGFKEFELGINSAAMYLGLAFCLLGAFASRKVASRKMFYIKYYCLTAVIAFVFIIIPYVTKEKNLFIFIILTLFLIHATGSYAWSVLIPYMHDIIPQDGWGKFYGKRLSILSLSGLAAIIFGKILDGKEIYTYTLIFVFGFFCLVLMIILMYYIPEEKTHYSNNQNDYLYGNLNIKFFTNLKSAYKFILIYNFLLSFNMGLFYPLRYKYILNNLGISIGRLSVYEFIGVAITILAFAAWGNFSTNKRYLPIILTLGMLKGIEPAIWIIAGRRTEVLYVIYVLFGATEGSGIVGTGLFFTLLNYLLSKSNTSEKTIIFNLSILVKSSAFIIASVLGGYLASQLSGINLANILNLNNIEIIMVLSLIISFFSALYLISCYRFLKKDSV